MSSASQRITGTLAVPQGREATFSKIGQHLIFSGFVASVVTVGGLISLASRIAGHHSEQTPTGKPSSLATPWGIDQD